jgi:hypothetical protein
MDATCSIRRQNGKPLDVFNLIRIKRPHLVHTGVIFSKIFEQK